MSLSIASQAEVGVKSLTSADTMVSSANHVYELGLRLSKFTPFDTFSSNGRSLALIDFE